MAAPSNDPQKKTTAWVLGDQLSTSLAGLAGRTPADTRVLLVRSTGKARSLPFHRQRLHLVWTAMERFGDHLEAKGFEVDRRTASTLAAGLAAHRADHPGVEVTCMEPLSFDGDGLLERHGVTVIKSDQMLCHHDEFAAWAGDKPRTRMEDFYRWMRLRHGLLIEPDGSPTGGRWNFDHENREPKPTDGRSWPAPTTWKLDDVDRRVLADMAVLESDVRLVGAPPTGWWPTSRRQALARLREVVEHVLPAFGPHEDAMLHGERRLAHSMLSSSMNIGLLHPLEVAQAAEAAFRAGDVPIASAEGFIRQVIGWREYVWGVYRRWMPDYRDVNVLDAHEPLPPAFAALDPDATKMRCVADVLTGLRDNGWNHHIERLMVLGNLALTAGVEPWAMVEWMWASYVDGAEWVMLPNLLGMSLHADGGRMATKPYASGGAYINKMSDHCKGCAYDPKQRVGERACPYTTLYWDFIARHAGRFEGNNRMVQAVRQSQRLADLDAVRERADEVRSLLREGRL